MKFPRSRYLSAIAKDLETVVNEYVLLTRDTTTKTTTFRRVNADENFPIFPPSIGQRRRADQANEDDGRIDQPNRLVVSPLPRCSKKFSIARAVVRRRTDLITTNAVPEGRPFSSSGRSFANK